MFEPQVKIFKKLKKKYKNKKNVKAFNYAISNKNGFRKLYINKHDLTSTFSKFNLKNKWLNYKAKLFNSTVNEMIKNIEISKTVTLKKVIDQKKIKEVDLAKIDTEGHEYEVLLGLKNKINFVDSVLIEFQFNTVFLNYNAKKIHNYLLKKKFILKKRFHFPFTSWEDRIYIKRKKS